MFKTRNFLRLFLAAILIISLISLITMFCTISAQESVNEETRQEITERTLRKNETQSILASENEEDLKKNVAEKEGYVYPDEKIYIDADK